MDTEKRKAYVRAWVAANREKVREYKRAYRKRPGVAEKERAYLDQNRERIYATNAEYRKNNAEKERARSRAKYGKADKKRMQATAKSWRERNRAKHLQIMILVSSRRRARAHRAPGNATLEQVNARVAFYGHRCAYCGGPFEHVDHVIPLARGGSNWPANLRPACRRCNTSKGSKLLTAWTLARRPL